MAYFELLGREHGHLETLLDTPTPMGGIGNAQVANIISEDDPWRFLLFTFIFMRPDPAS